MATNKHATIRYHALDQCFSNSGRRFYIDDLNEACNSALLEFWKNLKPGYDLFQSTMKPVKYTIGNDGKYKF